MGDVNDIQPTSINHIIGQRGVVEQVKVALDAAQEDRRRFDHAGIIFVQGSEFLSDSR
jgi:Holliday junction DNA helicase RuvB